MNKLIRQYLILQFLVPITIAQSQNFVKGSIITHEGDTILCFITKTKNRKDEEGRNYREVEIIDSVGMKRELNPRDIFAYTKGGVVYKSATFFGKDIFMKLIVNGRAMLYYYSDESGKENYIFKRIGEKGFNSIDINASQFDKMIDSYTRTTQHSANGSVIVMDRDKRFLSYFSEYFKDCPSIVRKLKMEFYTTDDIVAIFKEFDSNCGR